MYGILIHETVLSMPGNSQLVLADHSRGTGFIPFALISLCFALLFDRGELCSRRVPFESSNAAKGTRQERGLFWWRTNMVNAWLLLDGNGFTLF